MGDSISKALRARVVAAARHRCGYCMTEHFAWDKDATHIVGLTPTGCATVTALNLNNPYIVPARRLWTLAGWHPPKNHIDRPERYHDQPVRSHS